MLELDSSWKAVVVKARSGVSVVRKTNNDSGRGGGSEGTRSGFSKRSEKKGVGTNGGGGVSIGCEGGVDAKVQ
ncbi:uncharacterized protein MONOS_429 [Monocercomonoides exilis]|uniref:uncharacterized protein n=1 Tax=Monocercomonoides exilis TaxID=2049356 RepID=UPI00355A7CDB|nr:hypothetical protein MONOS_429 [Monocercomonoides exilis]|eukprot:MONOS_429.1-p1 / transcript=MONOS_429.1 / gene=MONOS_429 / organism=Monocercomonoides_exilis_PA203 / gene_product=unspecified product / transcript_product=unspecified product / location=Mono_scaffold00007:46219-46437(-) / protein_length=73 / sequence_SO=supercontig / SO=protein_coding / is_pseudo=false